ncbi:M50 family metallopeptidase [Virgibacillus halodenitrificans]|uniref:M50 family metallopeptidase n=1 Tax=Virgibacillus halodenitrificans TaxID=1482 RepID=UPI00045D0EBD|nr:M50 family metallopeptidase [Virgibacillus halodenitrificans]CDQ35593.1 Zn-dependent proteases [Virgibacillus halodenitrificans]
MSIPLLFYLILIVAPISIAMHELGHALMAIVLKAHKVEVSIGAGKKLGGISRKGFQLSIYSLYFLGGVVEHEKKHPYKLREIIWISLSGPIMNAILAFIVYLLYDWIPNNYTSLFLLFNIWLAVVNLIPFKIKEKQTDGYTIFKEIIRRI